MRPTTRDPKCLPQVSSIIAYGMQHGCSGKPGRTMQEVFGTELNQVQCLYTQAIVSLHEAFIWRTADTQQENPEWKWREVGRWRKGNRQMRGLYGGTEEGNVMLNSRGGFALSLVGVTWDDLAAAFQTNNWNEKVITCILVCSTLCLHVTKFIWWPCILNFSAMLPCILRST